MPTPVKPLKLHDYPLPCEADGYFIAGFVAGEGCFYMTQINMRSWSLRFSIGLDPKDEDALTWMRLACHGVGRQHTYAKKTSWEVSGIADAHYLVRLFDRFPLRSSKQRDFEIWRKAVLLRIACPKSTAHGFDWSPIAALNDELRVGRPSARP